MLLAAEATKWPVWSHSGEDLTQGSCKIMTAEVIRHRSFIVQHYQGYLF